MQHIHSWMFCSMTHFEQQIISSMEANISNTEMWLLDTIHTGTVFSHTFLQKECRDNLWDAHEWGSLKRKIHKVMLNIPHISQIPSGRSHTVKTYLCGRPESGQQYPSGL